MNRTDGQNHDDMFDALLESVHAEEPDAVAISSAKSRVWTRLQMEATSLQTKAGEVITGCAGFRSLFADYRTRTLTPARRSLVEDHLHECASCRKEFGGFGDAPGKLAKVVGIDAAPVHAARPSFWMPSKWAVAAMLMMGIGIGSWKFWEWFGPAPTGNRARVLSADGSV
ncbi:MAG: zf-HC2 domain-containing protein, partial [Bryobacteraceae bacterium]|nr:zf-HC2 domain-containing protein [Bryobacteraceae bacterium]